MITLFGSSKYFKVVSFFIYAMEIKRLKCAMLGAFTIQINNILSEKLGKFSYPFISICVLGTLKTISLKLLFEYPQCVLVEKRKINYVIWRP